MCVIYVFKYLVQLPLGGLSQAGVHRAPEGLDQGVGIHRGTKKKKKKT